MATVTRYTALITTVDPSSGIVGFVTKGDAQERRAIVLTTAVASRWPIEGETWLVRQENGSWYIDQPLPSTTSYEGITPGDAIINSPTGQVHVLGSRDGATDFSFNSVNIGQRGSAWYMYNGVGVPATGTFVGEVNGDFAVRQSDNEVFKRINGTWTDQNFANGPRPGPVGAGVWHGQCWASPGTGAAAIMGGGNLTPSDPNGCRYMVFGEWSGYTSNVSGACQTFLQIDGDDWGARGALDQFYFNPVSTHLKCGSFVYLTPTLAGGTTHGFSLIGKSISSANITCDINDWAQLTAFELR